MENRAIKLMPKIGLIGRESTFKRVIILLYTLETNPDIINLH